MSSVHVMQMSARTPHKFPNMKTYSRLWEYSSIQRTTARARARHVATCEHLRFRPSFSLREASLLAARGADTREEITSTWEGAEYRGVGGRGERGG